MSSDTVAIFAPAKINLYLHVTARRANGYHELDSLVVFADVGDWVRATHASDLTLEITGPHATGLSSGNDNLVMRAAEALWGRVGAAPGARVALEKNLPVSSGIGGGSADAAAAIKALVRLWGIHPGQHDLSGLALDLGADVPVCLAGRATYMSGIGEQLEPVEALPSLPAVLVNPGVAVSTPAVFKARGAGFSAPGRFDEMPNNVSELVQALAQRHNDLSDPACTLAPEISDVLAALENTSDCLFSRMSGSGATCFGLYANPDGARSAAAYLQQSHPDWWVQAATFEGAPR
jgi:4-diphosphocytidyl-2-C-methyl-D-erythritol kinase